MNQLYPSDHAGRKPGSDFLQALTHRIKGRLGTTLVYRDGQTIKEVTMKSPKAKAIPDSHIIGVFDARATTADLREALGL